MENYENVESGNLDLFSRIINFEDKKLLFKYHLNNFRKKLITMFEYDGIPDSIPKRSLELQIQHGYSIIVKHKDVLYQCYGGLGGKPDYNYLPTLATIAVPALPDLPKKWRIYWGYEYLTEETKDLPLCVVIPNDCLFLGTLPTNSYYASQLVENDLTLNCNLINFRLMNLLVASDSDSYKSLMGVIDDLKNGKISSALDSNFIFDAIKSLPFGQTQGNNIVQLLEERQYIKGSWWNEWGVQSNYNMKRETITSSENILNVDSLLSVSDDMLEMRKLGVERVNKIFNVDWSVDFSSAWKKLRVELKYKELKLKNEVNEKNFQNLEKKVGGDNNEINKNEPIKSNE